MIVISSGTQGCILLGTLRLIMKFRAFRMPVTLATIMKIDKNTNQKCHHKRFSARVINLKLARSF